MDERSPSDRSAIIAGASGMIGGHCLGRLLNDPAYAKVTALGRRPLALGHPKLTQHVIDFDRLEEQADLIQGNDLFCTLGTTIRQAGTREAFRKVDFVYVQALAAIAARNGARQLLVVSSLGADPSSRNFYYRVKGEMEDAVKSLPFRGVHIFRPSLLLGERRETRLGERIGGIVMQLAAPLMLGSLKRYRPIEGSMVAAAMIAIAKKDIGGVNIYESDRIREIAEGR